MWVDKIQSQNSELLSPVNPVQAILPDTPQPPRKFRADSEVSIESGDMERRKESSDSLSSLPTIMAVSSHGRGEYPVRPGSPRHDISSSPGLVKLTSDDSLHSMDLLDIKHLEISEGTSDVEEG